ncbi:MAG: hypothetical protein WC028_22985 [Candidatus Obscuribacterales bacterium]
MKNVNNLFQHPAASHIRYVALLLISVCLVLTPIAGGITMGFNRTFWVGVKAAGEAWCIAGAVFLAYALMEMLIARRQGYKVKSMQKL